MTITAPAPTRQIHRLSDIIDPADILEYEQDAYSPLGGMDTPTKVNGLPGRRTTLGGKALVESPSGQKLGYREYVNRPDRLLTLEERKQKIRENTLREIERWESESRAGTR